VALQAGVAVTVAVGGWYGTGVLVDGARYGSGVALGCRVAVAGRVGVGMGTSPGQ